MIDYSEWSVYEINSAILTLKVKAMGYKPRIGDTDDITKCDNHPRWDIFGE